MRVARLTLALGVGAVLALAGCSVGDDPGSGPTPRAEQVPTPEAAPEAPDAAPGVAALAAADAGPAENAPTTGYGEAYDLLYTAMEPSDALIDQWNAASDDQDWALVRATSGRLADSLQALQTTVLAADWPADAQAPAQDFAMALDREIGWYSYVAIARDEDEIIEAVQQPWTDVAVTASDELWTVLEDGLATEG